MVKTKKNISISF